ncbi:MAG: DUF4249 domain-containing protein [Bacteroidales bacterium]|nr:DUF4249 domain-containing protein [Bacteroidales bacterium]MCF8391051.1 DUF4249 domain-containing protein [Bacteroidales bacterium]
MRNKLLYILIVISLYSCEEPLDWEQKSELNPRLVVEGIVTNITGQNYVKLSFPVSQSGSTPRAVSGAVVALTNDGTSFEYFQEDSLNPGLYIPGDNFRTVVNQFYLLYISVGDYEFYARASMIPVVPLKKFLYYKDSENPGNYRILFPQSDDPSMIRYIADYYDSVSTNVIRSVFYHYNLSTIDVNEFFKPAKESLSFPSNTRVIRMKYSLAPDHEKYIRSLLSETEWKGGWFDVLPGNLPTNLSQGGVGYFGACSLVIDTVYFN